MTEPKEHFVEEPLNDGPVVVQQQPSAVHWRVTVSALLRKNVMLLWSSKVALIMMLLFPALAVGVTQIIDSITTSSTNNNYGSWSSGNDVAAITLVDDGSPLEGCQWFDVYGAQTKKHSGDCLTLLFTTSNIEHADTMNSIMAALAKESELGFSPIDPNSTTLPQPPFHQEIIGLSSLQMIAEFVALHHGRAAGIVVLQQSSPDLVMDISYNQTEPQLGNNRPETKEKLRAALGRGVLVGLHEKSNVNVKIQARAIVTDPVEEQDVAGNDNTDDNYNNDDHLSVGGFLLGIILALAYMLSTVTLISFLAREKQEGLIGSLRVVGMADSAYWASWIIIALAIDVTSSLLAMILAYILNAPILAESDFITPFILLVASGMSVYTFATITIGLVTRRRSVYGLQFIAIILVLVSSVFGITATTPGNKGTIFQKLIPGYILENVAIHIGSYSSLASSNENVTMKYTFTTLFDRIGPCNQTVLQEQGKCEYTKLFDDFSCWGYTDCRSGFYEYSTTCAPDDCYFLPIPDAWSIVIMILQTVVFSFLTWYFFKIIPSGNGIHRKPGFLCSSRYWRRSPASSNGGDESEQLSSEQEKSIRIRGISKAFGVHKAVDDINLDMANGQIFVMLGHNGAGKTTLINLLTGKMSPSSGDAYIMGHSVVHNVERIQELVGSVPQHDLLWSELSAYEHIRLFATIKGIANGGKGAREDAISGILKKVHLEKEAKQAAGGYSGGMKRRLSIALAGVGSPPILFMDEPTTGIDPLNRRRIWKLIQDLKVGRVIVLTTHLMQEADSLGDYIAILDHGKVQAQGTPLNLKTEYGSGYTLNILTHIDKVDRVSELAKQAIPGVELVTRSAGSIAIGIPLHSLNKVPQLTKDLQDEDMIREWGVSQSTLEEVFLRLVKHGPAAIDNSVAIVKPSLVSSIVEEDLAMEGSAPASDVMDLPIDQEAVEATFESRHIWILQIRSLLWKAYLLQKRSIVGSLVLLAIPVGVLLLLFSVAFKDLKIESYEVLVVPQGKALTYYYGEPCFHWLISDAMDGSSDPIWHHTNPMGILAAFQVGQVPPYESHNVYSKFQEITLTWSLKTTSNVSLAKVIDAVQIAIHNELKRTTKPSDEAVVDALCASEGFCGPCLVDPLAWNVTEQENNEFSFSSTFSDPYFDPTICLSAEASRRSCPLALIRFAMLQDSFLQNSSDTLGTPLSFGVIPSYTYPNTFEVFTEIQTSDSGHGFALCETCNDERAVLWLSGDGAAGFGQELNNFSTEVLVKEQDVLELVRENRQELAKRKVRFGESDDASCFQIFDNIESGWIVNKDAPTVLRGVFSNKRCNNSKGVKDAYQVLFPDAGVQVSRFDVLGAQIDVDVMTAVFPTEYYYSNMEVYNIDEQAVFSLHCYEGESDKYGTCNPGAEIFCAATALSLSYKCGAYNNIVSPTLVESTYNVILSAIQGGTLHVNTMAASYRSIQYVPALSLIELALIASLYALFIGLLMPTTSSTIVMEKHQRYVFSMLLNGLHLRNYWIATYTFHAIMCLIIMVFSVIFSEALRLAPFENLSYSYLTLTIITYIHAQFGFITLVSTFFRKERFAAIFLSIGSILLFGAAWIILAFVGSIMNHWPGMISLIPMLGASRAMFLLFWKKNFDEVLSICGILFGSGTLYLLIGIYVHGATGVGALWKPQCSCNKKSKLIEMTNKQGVKETEDEDGNMGADMDSHDFDVRQEVIRSLGLSPTETAIKIAHLGKVFPARPIPKSAVVDVCMAMDFGEIFGLLGPNGAGKTTVISMLVGQLDPSQGAAYVAGYHSVDQRQQALQELGIVPQFDVLYPDLSVREHLQMYALMKGVVLKENLSWALYIAKKVALGDDLFEKPCKNLSGGMKRRLSIAIALLSNPKILFLDEPTTGLDPDMKRAIWDIIEHMREGRCIILTTHAMDEAEALCNRIGIMAQGSLKCIGTPTHLRQRYGNTFELTFTVSPSTAGDLDDFLKKYSGTATRVSAYGQTQVYTMDKDQMDLTSLFTLVLRGQEEKLFSEWGISNTSLDEVFCAITAESEGAQANEF